MSQSTHPHDKISNFKLIIGLVIALGIAGGTVYGFHSGLFKPQAEQELPDGD